MKVYTVEGSVIDSGYYVYGIFATEEEAQKFIDDNWIWYWTWNNKNVLDSSDKVASTIRPKGYQPDHPPSGPDDYCQKDDLIVVEYEVGKPIKLEKQSSYLTPMPWRL